MVEILAPAGNMEKMKTAFKFGADACYLAGKKFGLRAFSDNFTLEELKEAVEFAHGINKRVFVTINIVAHNSDFDGLEDYLKYLNEIGVDGIIVSDIGIMNIAKNVAKDLELHMSTQANITNKYIENFIVIWVQKDLFLQGNCHYRKLKKLEILFQVMLN